MQDFNSTCKIKNAKTMLKTFVGIIESLKWCGIFTSSETTDVTQS